MERRNGLVFTIVILLVSVISMNVFAAAAPVKDSPVPEMKSGADGYPRPEPNKKALEEWQSMKYGLFIHWGIYSLCEGVWEGEQIKKLGEQIQRHAKIPQEEYQQLAGRFNPVKFDADKYVEIAKNAGMKYIVITSKHHDGFNMFHTELSEFNIVDATPYKKDIIKQLADACKRGGLKFGLYYSNPDWNYPHAIERKVANEYSVFEKISPKHEEYEVGQLKELLSNYGPIFELFFDMGNLTYEQSARFASTVHETQPECLVSGRVMNNQGDFLTMPDNHIPDEVIEMAWETPATLYLKTNTNTWGYKNWVVRHPINEKTKEQIRLMAKVVSRGGNYLLNVGPKSDGTIIDYEIEILEKMGEWMRVNGESIYDTQPDPFKKLSWGHVTVGPGTIYLHVFDWPKDGKLVVPGLKNKVRKAVMLADKKTKLKTTVKGDDLVVTLPAEEPDENLSVIALSIKGELKIVEPAVASDKDGVVVLTEENSISHGYYSGMTYKSLHANVSRSWNAEVGESGTYAVELAYGKVRDAKELAVTVGDKTFKTAVKAGSAKQVVQLGTVELTKSSTNKVLFGVPGGNTTLRLVLDHIKLTPIK
jgi:alpha-L-fucosidase